MAGRKEMENQAELPEGYSAKTRQKIESSLKER
jgi:hypothetical protein